VGPLTAEMLAPNHSFPFSSFPLFRDPPSCCLLALSREFPFFLPAPSKVCQSPPPPCLRDSFFFSVPIVRVIIQSPPPCFQFHSPLLSGRPRPLGGAARPSPILRVESVPDRPLLVSVLSPPPAILDLSFDPKPSASLK